jgi:DNA-binding MarR family transcriptional regulator
VQDETTAADVDQLADRLHRALIALIPRSRRRHSSRVAIADVTLAQLSILLTLHDQGPIRMAKLAAIERVSAPTITVSIRRLETLGLVKRSPDPADLRSKLVDITPKGRALHRESLADMPASAVQRLSRLSQADLDSLTKALAPLQRRADSADRRTPATAVRSALNPSTMLSRPAPRASGR